MAWLEYRGGAFRIRFRYGGDKHYHALRTSDEKEAKDALARFEENSRLIDRAIIAAPPEAADLGVYILSGGKHATRPSQETRPDRPTLKTLLRSYLDEFPVARRSEIRRALVADFDFDEKIVAIRERKKDHETEETYRTVPMSARLEDAMRELFATTTCQHAISSRGVPRLAGAEVRVAPAGDKLTGQ